MTKTSIVALFAIGLFGCGEGTDPQAIQQRVELQPFQSCGQLESHIKEIAIREMELRIDQEIDYLKSYEGGWGFGSADGGAMSAADAGASSSSPATPDDGPAAHTTTNTQVEDVDEPDFVKNDGKRILVLSGNRLWVTKSWPPADMSLVGMMDIEGSPTQMFLDSKDRVVVFSYVQTQSLFPQEGSCIGYDCYYGYGNALKVTVIDIKDETRPRPLAEVLLPGRYRSARRVGSAVRIVLSDSFRWPKGVRFYPDHYDWDDLQATIAAYEELKEKNRGLIQGAPLDSWLPHMVTRSGGGAYAQLPYECKDFYRPNAPVRLGMATVVSLNLDKITDRPNRVSVIGGVDEIYANTDSLYLAGQHWWWWSLPGQKDYTYLHKFDISDPNKARYVASGGVEGHLIDQFAMDEHEGYFRVATTVQWREESEESPWGWGQSQTVNRVSVLRENAGQLEQIGRTKDLAEGERIFSVRFQGDHGYVVTFRQVDPLFTLDLSKPAAPRVVGELKVPGFSTYIHPLDSKHLLTIGEHRPDPNDQGITDWNERRLKLTIFDVSNFAAPKEKFTELVGTSYGWSEASYEHKAFNYFAQRKLLAIPFSDYTWDYSDGSYWDSFVSEVRVFKIDADKGITKAGALSLKDIYVQRDDYGWTSYYSPWVRRSVMATDSQGVDYVYAIADVGVRVAAIGNLDTSIKTILFQ